MFKTHDTAGEMICPLARTFGATDLQAGCRGHECAVWRKRRLMTSDKGWKEAVKAEAERTGEKPPYAKASRSVTDDPEKFGIRNDLGYCGLGGEPSQ